MRRIIKKRKANILSERKKIKSKIECLSQKLYFFNMSIPSNFVCYLHRKTDKIFFFHFSQSSCFFLLNFCSICDFISPNILFNFLPFILFNSFENFLMNCFPLLFKWSLSQAVNRDTRPHASFCYGPWSLFQPSSQANNQSTHPTATMLSSTLTFSFKYDQTIVRCW